MRRWAAACHLALITTLTLSTGWAQDPVGIVPDREISSAIPQLRRTISVKLEGVSMDAALQAVAKRAKLPITYNDAILPRDRKVWLSADEIPTEQALATILRGSGLKLVALTSGQVVVVKQGRQEARYRLLGATTVSGRVSVKETGALITGASVTLTLPDSSLRAVTNDSGAFLFANVPPGTHTIMVRYIGYQSLTKKIIVDSIPVRVDLALETRALALEELVTTATGQLRRRDIGNAITTIRADSVMQTAPIRSLTDLLENRVPGMTLQHTSGAPGDPARIRLRGIGSVMRSNDPVVIVDGVRIYAAQAEARSGNLTNTINRAVRTSNRDVGTNAPAPSPLDQIDPNIIEKIEVFKGPSAATLYGADAANGVIVVTTKRGKPGPTRWNATITRGRTTKAGDYPEGYFRWGQSLYHNAPVLCAVTNLTCQPDSLVRFQALNEPDLTVLGTGKRTEVSLTALGGNQGLTYSVTGTYGDEIGLLQLPAFEVERFQASFNREPLDWMRRPHRLQTWKVTSNIVAQLGQSANVTLFSSVSRSEQQRSTLEDQLARLTGTYVDQVNGIYYTPSSGNDFFLQPNSTLFSIYYTRTTASALTVTTGLHGQWRPSSWLDFNGQAGLNFIPREDQVFLPAGLVAVTDSGAIIQGSGRSLVSNFNLQGVLTKNLPWNFVFTTSVGANLTSQSTSDMTTAATGLVPGTSTISGARQILAAGSRTSSSVYGWYIEPRVSGRTMSLSTGLRLDGGSAYGARVSGGNLLKLPKLNGTWTISDERFFPFKSLFSSLRLRGAYGQAQVQPGPADRLRLYGYTVIGGSTVSIASLGNTQLRPERSTEIEGGFEADLMDGRMTVEFTGFRKNKVDALMAMNLAPSVNGGGIQVTNIGNILNTGMELVLGLTPVRSPALTWNAQLSYSSNNNVLTKLGRGVTASTSRGLVEGYPIGSRWAKPIIGYADKNENGVLERSEIKVADSAAFMGRLYPAYTAGLHTNVALFGGAVSLSAGFAYNAGATQINQGFKDNWVHAAALFDPDASPGELAAVLASVVSGGPEGTTDYGLMQKVSTLRFNSLSANYRVPTRAARLLGAQQLTVAVQGSNLGLHTNYRGKDPDVNAWKAGEGIVDGGQLAQPRTWQLSLFLNY